MSRVRGRADRDRPIAGPPVAAIGIGDERHLRELATRLRSEEVVPLEDMAIYGFKGLSWGNSANCGTVSTY